MLIHSATGESLGDFVRPVCWTKSATYSWPITLVVYHLPKKSRNFGWNVNGKTNLVFPNGKFPGKMGFLERWTKIPKQNFWMEIVRSIRSFWPVPGLSDWIAWNCKWNSKSRMEIPIWVLTLSIYHTCRPTRFSDQMVNNLCHLLKNFVATPCRNTGLDAMF